MLLNLREEGCVVDYYTDFVIHSPTYTSVLYSGTSLSPYPPYSHRINSDSSSSLLPPYTYKADLTITIIKPA